MRHLAAACLGLSALLLAPALRAQSADDANKANNPLNLAASFGVQNYYTPRLFGTRSHTNDLYLRPTLPFGPGDWIGVPQILRPTIPISTRPQADGSYRTGLGDISVFDIFLLSEGDVNLGVGPMLTMPTATDTVLGSGKWSGGLSAVAVHSSPRGVFGGLLEWQHSFAGQSNRETVHTATFQPLILHNLKEGWYLRSTATWTFNLQNKDYYIPVGAGVGRAWRVGKTIVNTFVEPQWTVARKGENLPQFTVFAGVNFTFGH